MGVRPRRGRGSTTPETGDDADRATRAPVPTCPLYRDDASGSIDLAPADVTYIEEAYAIDRFVGAGSDDAPERVRVHAVTSFVGF